MGHEIFFEDPVDLAVYVLVLHLPAAFLDANELPLFFLGLLLPCRKTDLFEPLLTSMDGEHGFDI